MSTKSRTINLAEAYLHGVQAKTVERPGVAELADGWLDWLRDRARNGDALADLVLVDVARAGAQKFIQRCMGHGVFWADPETGGTLGARTRVGVKVRDDDGTPLNEWQQALFPTLTRAELIEWRQRQITTRDNLSHQVAWADRVLAAWDDHPAAETVDEVCALAGIEIPVELRDVR